MNKKIKIAATLPWIPLTTFSPLAAIILYISSPHLHAGDQNQQLTKTSLELASLNSGNMLAAMAILAAVVTAIIFEQKKIPPYYRIITIKRVQHLTLISVALTQMIYLYITMQFLLSSHKEVELASLLLNSLITITVSCIFITLNELSGQTVDHTHPFLIYRMANLSDEVDKLNKDRDRLVAPNKKRSASILVRVAKSPANSALLLSLLLGPVYQYLYASLQKTSGGATLIVIDGYRKDILSYTLAVALSSLLFRFFISRFISHTRIWIVFAFEAITYLVFLWGAYMRFSQITLPYWMLFTVLIFSMVCMARNSHNSRRPNPLSIRYLPPIYLHEKMLASIAKRTKDILTEVHKINSLVRHKKKSKGKKKSKTKALLTPEDNAFRSFLPSSTCYAERNK
ncbi:hypothetical protein ACUH9X_03475 [Dermabacteraceae bacterium P13147]